MTIQITGTTAADIADSIRALVDRGEFMPGASLPSVRALADDLGVNRNTVVAAYRLLSQAGVTSGHGRGGTRVAGTTRSPQEGFAAGTVLRDLGSGNPDPGQIPPLAPALATLVDRPVLYGEPTIDPDLENFARSWFAPDLAPQEFALTVTSGAVDAIERLLAQALVRDDFVALEDPCFLATIHTVRLGGYRPLPVAMDEQGMRPEALRAALAGGARAVLATPRAQNPTGVAMTAARAEELRAILAGYPYVLIIEDDHYSLLSESRSESLIGAQHQRFAVIRSVSKFLGPDMSLAMVATDAHTRDRLAMRLSPGTTWVSHILQRLTVAQLTSASARAIIEQAGEHYVQRNHAFAAHLREHGIAVPALGALSLWIETAVDAENVVRELMKRGWLVRTEAEFSLDGSVAAGSHVRMTVHNLSDSEHARLAADLAAAIRIAGQ